MQLMMTTLMNSMLNFIQVKNKYSYVQIVAIIKASECVGRGAFRLCKKGTKFCAWMQGIPDFFEWIHICLAYDVFKDTYKIYKNGEKVESGSWSENPNVLKFHEFSKILNVNYFSQSDQMVFLYLVRIRTMQEGVMTGQFNVLILPKETTRNFGLIQETIIFWSYFPIQHLECFP